jgi:iron complex transport system substrate-binding protein
VRRLLLSPLFVALTLAAACTGPAIGAPGAVGTPAPAVSPSAPLPTTPPAAARFPMTVTDDAGRPVGFAEAPRRIVSLSPGNTEILYALGVGDRLVVTDKYSDYPAENRAKARLTTYPKPNVEELVALKPDLVLVLVEGDEFIQQMDAQGIKVLKIFPKTFEGVLGDIELLGRVTDTEPRARELTAGMRARADAVVAKTKGAPRVRVLYELDASDPARPFVAGPSGFFGNLVPMAGGENVFDDLGRPSGRVDTEQVVSRDPEVIILGDANLPVEPQSPDMVGARPGWKRIAAVRTGRVYPLDNAYLERPGPRLVEGLERMARLLHPELFP